MSGGGGGEPSGLMNWTRLSEYPETVPCNFCLKFASYTGVCANAALLTHLLGEHSITSSI